MRVPVVLPHFDHHVPKDGKMPDGMGLPVRVHYEGDPIGRVVAWEDQGDGRARAELEVDLSDLNPDDLEYGLDANVRGHFEGDRVVVESIGSLKGVGVWPAGTRDGSEYKERQQG